jgi:alkylated DNA repair dioxygenase AlkB
MIKQTSLFDNVISDKEILLNDDGKVIMYESFFSQLESDKIFKVLLNEIDWGQEHIKLYGKSIPIPRLTAWYGEKDKPYTYSGIAMTPKAWHPLLLDIKNRIESVSDRTFNSVLLNYYRDGNDSVSWHSDDESELGENPSIGSVSFGGTRKFSLKHKNSEHPNHKELIDIDLVHGSFLLMDGECQSYWLHQIAKTKKQVKPRINLTFRYIYQ